MNDGELAGVVLAAGRGSRMRPFTDLVPKALLTINNDMLLALALKRISALTDRVGVNAHHLAGQLEEQARRLLPGVHVFVESDQLLGTAGALRRMRDWIDGRDVIVGNSDVWLSDPIDYLLEGWDRRRPRLLVTDIGRPADFGRLRFLGVSTLPGPMAAALEYQPDGLYAAVWREAFRTGELEFVQLRGSAFDCGTPAEFLAANLRASGGESVIAPDARVLGSVERSVLLAGAKVAAGEHLIGAIRDGFGNTVTVDPA